MHAPYTTEPAAAVLAAHGAAGLSLLGLLVGRPIRPLLATWLFGAAIVLTALTPWIGVPLHACGVPISDDFPLTALRVSAGMAVVAAGIQVLRGPVAPLVVAALFAGVIEFLARFLPNTTTDLLGFELAVYGGLVGLGLRAREVRGSSAPGLSGTYASTADGRFARHDLVAFVVAFGLAAWVAHAVLRRFIDSSDEWAYTFQAAVFAKGLASAPEPACGPAYQNFWVFPWEGRLFSQYTPGWSWFMAPFAPFRAFWLAGPVSFGLLAVAVARLTRLAARETYPGDPRAHRLAGGLAAMATVFSTMLVVNGASRYAHVFVAALFAACVEAAATMTDPREPLRRRMRWAATLGAGVALSAATRPGDAVMLSLGIAAYLGWAAGRRQIPWRVLSVAVASFAPIALVTLIVLRLQVGRWFTTGYALTKLIHPWAVASWSWPKPDEWRFGFPLAAMGYSFWPLAPSLGLAGLVVMRGRARKITWMLSVGTLALFVFYALLNFGRGFDWGYGPRYQLPVVVALAVGGGVLWAPFVSPCVSPFVRTRARSTLSVTFALVAIAAGLGRIAPLLLTHARDSVLELNLLHQRIRDEQIHHALVLLPKGIGWKNDGLDLTQNLPIDLYPDQDVIVAMELSPELSRCVVEHHPTRAVFRARPGEPFERVR